MAMFQVGDRVLVQVGRDSHRGLVTGSRRTMQGTVVTVDFYHQGRRESIEYFSNDGALRPLGD